MKIALLGSDPESLALAQAAHRTGHTIMWCGDLSPDCPQAFEWLTEDLAESWEALLDNSLADAVIVGRGLAAAHLRAERLNQLTKAKIPVLTTFPLVDSVLAYYEIDMSRGESKATLQHYNPLTEQTSLVDQCAQWIEAGHPELGPIEQVVWERPLAERSRERVLWHFSRDVEFLSLISRRLNRLGALGSPDQAATYAGLSIQLLGKSEVPVRWQVEPVEGLAGARLVLIAKQGKLTIEFDEAGKAKHWTVSQAGQTESTALETADLPMQCLQRFATAVQSEEQTTSTWSQALAAMELTDTIEISLRRGRMIEVHQQQLTEQLAFKGTMSAFGCGVLMILPPLFLFGGWIAELVGLPVADYWPHALLAFLALFLGVQLIPKLLFSKHRDEV